MTRVLIRTATFGAALTILCATPVSLQWSPQRGPAVAVGEALAVAGPPATPGSVAGVTRRMNGV